MNASLGSKKYKKSRKTFHSIHSPSDITLSTSFFLRKIKMFAKVILVGLLLTTLSEALPLSKNEVSNLKSKLNLFKTNMVKNDFVDETIDQNESEINEIDQDEDEPENEDHSENDIIEDETDENDHDSEVIVGVSTVVTM